MSHRPIFVATHPRACSTAFERVFMTRHDTLQCVHEPFGDAYYFGPERLAERYESDAQARKESGYSESTYRTIFDRIAKENSEGKRVFIKDMAQYWIPPNGKPATMAPSLVNYRRGVGTDTTQLSPVQTRTTNGDASLYPYNTPGEPNNPTVIPADLLKTYHFTFLIRHPKYSIPSYYRCTIPPLDKMTGFYHFRPDEAGYEELRRLFDYLRNQGQIGPKLAGNQAGEAGSTNGTETEGGGVEICVIDADDLLDKPSAVIEAYCKTTGIEWDPGMLRWNTDKDQDKAKEAFAKWKGFHEDALDSTELRQRTHYNGDKKKAPKTDAQLFAEWTEKYGEKGAKVIRDTVQDNVEHYDYLKQFAIKV
ncbi:helicase [Pleosporales sp. CAS-2024a]